MVHLEDPVDELNDEVECMKEGSFISLRHEQSPLILITEKKDMC